MMEYPLTIAFMLRRAEQLFGHKAIVTRRPDKTIHRHTYADFVPRAKKLAVALGQLVLRHGDSVATLCWNQYEHLEAYFGIPLAGMVLHTINPRLHPTDLTYIVNDAEDRVLIIDDTLLPVLEKFRADVRIEHIVVIEHGAKAPAGTIGYETLLAGADPNAFAYPELDEGEAAAMCYTSGTTGRPKGVVYSHRALVLHSLGQASGAVGVLESDVVLPVVPMFHVNAWGLAFTCTMVGATQVHPGPHLDAESLCDLFVGEHVTYTAGVPTIWLGLLRRLDERPKEYDLSRLRLLVVGGSAAPKSMIRGFDERHGLRVLHAWGMTETTPLGVVSSLMSDLEQADAEAPFAHGPPRGRGGCGHRGSACPLAGASSRVRGVQARVHGDRGGAPCVPRTQLREVVAARRVRVRDRDTKDRGGQVPQDGAPRALRDGAGTLTCLLSSSTSSGRAA